MSGELFRKKSEGQSCFLLGGTPSADLSAPRNTIMRTPKKVEEKLPWIQLSFAVVYGILLPLVYCTLQGWNLVISVPVAAVWLLVNLPVIENWAPKLGRLLLRGSLVGLSTLQQWTASSSKLVREKWQNWRIVASSPVTSETS